MTSLARRERAVLADLLDEVGPDAPTLCGDWTTRDLAAHLIVREGSPAAVGIVVRPLAGWTERNRRGTTTKDFDRLVEEVRSGPPLWSPLRVGSLDDALNTLEYVVHHEDVRRAVPGWTPRPLDARDDATLWHALCQRAKLLMRRSPVGVVLATPDGRELVARRGEPVVTVSGDAAELVMYAHGRTGHATVELTGDDDAIAQFTRTRLDV